ncbi:MAG: TIGR00730 family Rossman fold protein [Polyangiales bacterium]
MTPDGRPCVCVFCGSSTRVDGRYLALGRDVGTALAAAGCDVVYGGASVGLMGAVADAALAGGSRVVGVIPHTLRNRELAHGGLTELHVVEGMAPRKALMFERATAFLTLPGGFGTLDELFEAVTLRQIGEHGKRAAVLEFDGFWAPLLAWCKRAVDERFVPDEVAGAIEVVDGVGALVAWLASLRG